MPKLLFVTTRMSDPAIGGRALLSRLHYRALQALLGEKLVVFELDPRPVAGASGAFQALRGFLDGLTPETVEAIVERARAERVSRVYIDGSNLGRLAARVRKQLPDVEVLTFFHNVEARFFLGAFRKSKSVRALAVLAANYVGERFAVRYSDRLITLSSRDSSLLARLYGRAGTDLLPMAMEDVLERTPPAESLARPEKRDYALFVGGAFYANVAGIKWYAREVASHVRLDTVIVGRGLEEFRAELERPGKVRLAGAVDRLESWYLDAKLVIAPIFDGSGMKTKVAEALMHGKRIVGTPEAFSGYEDVARQAGWICETREDFVTAIAEAAKTPLPRFDPALRKLYEQRYSRAAAQQRLADILAIPTRTDKRRR